MTRNKIKKGFFERPADEVARDLLGKILVRKTPSGEKHAKIVETEAYFDDKDPGSWARLGKRKDNKAMWSKPGSILVKNVHKYNMLNFVTGIEGKPEAVLIRALEPLNFDARCSGPGLLTLGLDIDRAFNEKHLEEHEGLDLLHPESKEDFEIVESFRVGLKKDLPKKMRFYIKNNPHISRK